jgi:hypothetical protein
MHNGPLCEDQGPPDAGRNRSRSQDGEPRGRLLQDAVRRARAKLAASREACPRNLPEAVRRARAECLDDFPKASLSAPALETGAAAASAAAAATAVAAESTTTRASSAAASKSSTTAAMSTTDLAGTKVRSLASTSAAQSICFFCDLPIETTRTLAELVRHGRKMWICYHMNCCDYGRHFRMEKRSGRTALHIAAASIALEADSFSHVVRPAADSDAESSCSE